MCFDDFRAQSGQLAQEEPQYSDAGLVGLRKAFSWRGKVFYPFLCGSYRHWDELLETFGRAGHVET